MSSAREIVALALLLCGVGVARREAPEPAYPTMAPVEQYRSASQEDEIAFARNTVRLGLS
jgi:hypothetical protein